MGSSTNMSNVEREYESKQEKVKENLGQREILNENKYIKEIGNLVAKSKLLQGCVTL